MKEDLLIGKEVQFEKDNNIHFVQDFLGCKCIPHDVIFTVKKDAGSDHKSHWLVARGFGDLTLGGSYGNGPIMVKDSAIVARLVNLKEEHIVDDIFNDVMELMCSLEDKKKILKGIITKLKQMQKERTKK